MPEKKEYNNKEEKKKRAGSFLFYKQNSEKNENIIEEIFSNSCKEFQNRYETNPESGIEKLIKYLHGSLWHISKNMREAACLFLIAQYAKCSIKNKKDIDDFFKKHLMVNYINVDGTSLGDASSKIQINNSFLYKLNPNTLEELSIKEWIADLKIKEISSKVTEKSDVLMLYLGSLFLIDKYNDFHEDIKTSINDFFDFVQNMALSKGINDDVKLFLYNIYVNFQCKSYCNLDDECKIALISDLVQFLRASPFDSYQNVIMLEPLCRLLLSKEKLVAKEKVDDFFENFLIEKYMGLKPESQKIISRICMGFWESTYSNKYLGMNDLILRLEKKLINGSLTYERLMCLTQFLIRQCATMDNNRRSQMLVKNMDSLLENAFKKDSNKFPVALRENFKNGTSRIQLRSNYLYLRLKKRGGHLYDKEKVLPQKRFMMLE